MLSVRSAEEWRTRVDDVLPPELDFGRVEALIAASGYLGYADFMGIDSVYLDRSTLRVVVAHGTNLCLGDTGPAVVFRVASVVTIPRMPHERVVWEKAQRDISPPCPP